MADSQLSSARYGYDFVVSTTQQSINATMKRYLNGLSSPLLTVCFVADGNGVAQAIDYEELKKKANGSDPFAIPGDIDPSTNSDIKNLMGARFMGGFRAKIGLPEGVSPTDLPDILSFDSGSIAKVSFRMYCSDFDLVQLSPGGGYTLAPKWFAASQDRNNPWTFESKVDLSQSVVDKNSYHLMPPDVQKAIHNKGSMAFSVQQLWFDMSTASLYSSPTIEGVARDSELGMILQRDFLTRYFDLLRGNGQPLLGVNVVDDKGDLATFSLTDFELQVNPYLDANGRPEQTPTPDQAKASTLSYLCATMGNKLPPSTAFDWNWLSTDDIKQTHGIISINRNTFAQWLSRAIRPMAQRRSLQPHVKVVWDGGLNYNMNFTQGNPEEPPVDGGPEVLKYRWKSENTDDEAGLNGALGAMSAQSFYDLTVSFSGNTITVVQNLVIWIYVRVGLTKGDGNVVDRTITDTYTLAIDAQGQLGWTLQSNEVKRDYDPSVNPFLNFFSHAQDVINMFKEEARNFVSSNLVQAPISELGQFFFPGGRTFAFRSAAFSKFQDLTSLITYLDPSDDAPVYMAVLPEPLLVTVPNSGAVAPLKYTSFVGNLEWREDPSDDDKDNIKALLAEHMLARGYINVRPEPNHPNDPGSFVWFQSTNPMTITSVDSPWASGFFLLGSLRKYVRGKGCAGYNGPPGQAEEREVQKEANGSAVGKLE
ncbi:MAG: hypothetical protein M1820_006340 [Bogoriella megaspora]|nr:MAG: hypothetical protein M1820_006340 [Bogoriella megaspora]